MTKIFHLFACYPFAACYSLSMSELQNWHLCLLYKGRLYPLGNGASFSREGAGNLAAFLQKRARIKWGKPLAFNITNHKHTRTHEKTR